MSVAAIICEYNPFHNGHKFQIDAQKKLFGTDGIVAIMSGNFVQRGEPAICDKWSRAKMALLSGVDLVIELPTVFATQSAERFARGGVSIADSLGIVDFLSFGAECDDVTLLKAAAEIVEKEETKEKIIKLLKGGMSYPSARMSACGDEFKEILSKPNNILAIEYIKALCEIKSNIIPNPVKRKGCDHDSEVPENEFASASFLRKCILTGENFMGFIPENCVEVLHKADIFTDKTLLDGLITYLLRTKTAEELSELSDMTEGIEHRFEEAAMQFATVDEIAEFVKTKRYTKTRVDRLMMNILLSISKEDVNKKPEYIRVLGFNENGKQMLSEIKKKSRLPIITKVADARLSDAGMKMLSTDIYATDIYSMICMKSAGRKSGLDYLKSPVIVK